MDGGKKINGTAALVLKDTPYMVPPDVDRSNSDHYLITEDYLLNFAELIDDVLFNCVHSHIFS